ncbi:unnamed protein product, partial [Coregonus sp. 'balchen']
MVGYGLMLLHWLANNIHTDDNGNMRLNFNPTRGDYGFHFYGNSPYVLPFLLPEKQQGQGHTQSREEGSNQFIADEVYVTQHYPPNGIRGSGYDPDNTYCVNVSLLSQIQRIPTRSRNEIRHRYNVEINNNNLVRNYGHPPDLALLSAIILLLDQGVIVVLYKNNGSESKLNRASVGGEDSGSYNSSVPLNPGLQVRLHKEWWNYFGFGSPTIGEEIWRGSEFHNTNREIPVDINRHDASLQLFVKDGMACAHLYVKKSFPDWKNTFNNSWVGFYSSEGTLDYNTWQWAVKFSEESCSDWEDIPEYDVYVYKSSMAMSPGVQARFMLEKLAMVGRGFLGCLILCLSLASECAIKGTLNSINYLKDIDFGHTSPPQGLMLLHWLADNIYTYNNGNMRINFNPTRRDYGFHFYRNYDIPRSLPFLPPERGIYYSLGNNNCNGAMTLPEYVTKRVYNSWGPESNKHRVILRVREEGSNQFIVDNVYINHNSLECLENIWGHTTGLALLLAIVLYFTRPKFLFKQQAFHVTSQPQSGMEDKDNTSIKLEVKTTNRGKNWIIWSGIPKRLLDQGVMVVLYKNNGSESKLDSPLVGGKASGSYNTSAPLNPDLQVRLHKEVMILWVFAITGDELCRHSEFHDANREIPVDIIGYDASLQLFVKDGKACTRLIVKKSGGEKARTTPWETCPG